MLEVIKTKDMRKTMFFDKSYISLIVNYLLRNIRPNYYLISYHLNKYEDLSNKAQLIRTQNQILLVFVIIIDNLMYYLGSLRWLILINLLRFYLQ